jgi:hypothetical protein
MWKSIVLCGVLLMALSACGGNHPTYEAGKAYGYKYITAPNAARLIVLPSFLPKVCATIAKGNPYGVPDAPGANPGSQWIKGCIAGLYEGGYTDPEVG